MNISLRTRWFIIVSWHSDRQCSKAVLSACKLISIKLQLIAAWHCYTKTLKVRRVGKL